MDILMRKTTLNLLFRFVWFSKHGVSNQLTNQLLFNNAFGHRFIYFWPDDTIRADCHFFFHVQLSFSFVQQRKTIGKQQINVTGLINTELFYEAYFINVKFYKNSKNNETVILVSI